MALVCGPVGGRIRRSQFEKVEGNRLYMKQDGKDIAIGKSKSDDFRKTDASGRGYQLWFMDSNQLRLQRTSTGSLSFFNSQKRLRKGVHLSCGKRKKVKAGVLLHAVTMAAIFSLLLQFYLNRQVAHYQDYA